MDLDSRVEKAQINAKQINKLMKGDAQPVFTRYDDGRPAENLFNKEGLYTGGSWRAQIFGQRKPHASQIHASEVMY